MHTSDIIYIPYFCKIFPVHFAWELHSGRTEYLSGKNRLIELKLYLTSVFITVNHMHTSTQSEKKY